MPSLRQHLARIKEEYRTSPTVSSLDEAEIVEYKKLITMEPPELLKTAEDAPNDSVFERACIPIVRSVSGHYAISPYRSAMQVIEAAVMELKDKLVERELIKMFVPSRGYLLAFNLAVLHHEKKIVGQWIYSSVETCLLFVLGFMFITKVVSRLPGATIHTHNWNLHQIMARITCDSGFEWLARVLTGELIPDYPRFFELVPKLSRGFQSVVYRPMFERLEHRSQREKPTVGPTSEKDEADGEQEEIRFPSERDYWLDIWANNPGRYATCSRCGHHAKAPK